MTGKEKGTVSKEKENLAEERNEAKVSDTAKAQELTGDELDEVAGGFGEIIMSAGFPSTSKRQSRSYN